MAAPFRIHCIFFRNAILLVHGVLISLAAHALDLDAEKARIRQEVVLETPDQSLVDALTEIRFKREVLHQVNAKKKPAPGPAVTVAVGRENSLGYEYTWKNSMHGLRLEFNWQEPRSENTMFDGALYSKRTRYQSVGAYYVMSPFENGFRVMTGLRFNDIKTTYAVNAGGLANVNGNRVTLSPQDHLTYRFSLPRATPYIGIGFVKELNDLPGLAFFGDVGATFGRYNAQANTNISKSLNVDAKQVENELNAMRNDRFSKRYLWSAKLGLRYSY